MWRNNHASFAVVSTSCKHSASAADGLCSKYVIRIPTPEPDTRKYLNLQYKDKAVRKMYCMTFGARELIED